MDIKDKKSLQFELWQTCNSRCKFCVIPDTKILMADYSTKNIQDIKPGDMVLGVSKESTRFSLVPTKVLNIGSRDYTGEIYGKFTAEHPILATRPSRKSYVLAKNSQTQIKINLPEMSNIDSDDYKIGYIIGCFRGDGCYKTYLTKEHTYLTKKRISKNGKLIYNGETEVTHYNPHNIYKMRFFVKDEDIVDKLKKCLDYFNDYFYTKNCCIKNIRREAIFANTKIAYDWLTNIINNNLLINNTKDYCKGFLAGIFDCEGSNSKGSIRLSQNEGQTLEEIIRCLTFLDYKFKYEDFGKCKTCRIMGNSRLKFITDINPGCKRKIYTNLKYEYETVKGRLPKNSYQGKVYNFETETNNYIADNIVVHNCYLGESNLCTPIELKLKAVNDAIAFLNDEEKIAPYNTVSYIGGEFFQGQLDTPELKNRFFDLMRKTAELQISGKMKEVWIMCTLTIGDQKDLYTSLNILNEAYIAAGKPELMEQVWIVTSYDTIGRFHTQKMLDNWEYHMQHIHEVYPSIHFNTCTILTQDLITKYLNDEWSFHDFINKHHTAMFFKQPSPGSTKPKDTDCELIDQYQQCKEIMEAKLPGFFPKRETFLEFLVKFKDDCPDLWDKLFNIKYRADDLYRNYNQDEEGKRMQLNHRAKNKRTEMDEDFGEMIQKIGPCGHLINYYPYIDSKECCMCDKEFIDAQF